jgi:dipeptidyl aminopeptidase/acylaminoacyl peptidase
MELARFRLALAIASLVAASPAFAAADIPTGIAAFTRHSRFIDAKISPKGTYVGAISIEGGTRSLVVIDLNAHKIVTAFRPGGASVGDFEWVNDGRIAVELLDEADLLASPVNHGEIYAIDANGEHGSLIYGYRVRRASGNLTSRIRETERVTGYATIIGTLRGDERRILIQTGHWDDAVGNSEVYKLDTYTGKFSLVTTNPGPHADFLTDENGEPRIAVAMTADLKRSFFFRDPDQGWNELKNLKGISNDSYPMGFAKQTRSIELVEPAAKGFALYAVNVDSGERKLISQNDWVPPRDFLRDRNSMGILAVRYLPDVPVYDFVAPDHLMSRFLKRLLETYGDDAVRVLNTTDDQKKAVVLVYSDRNPGKFLLVDIEKGTAEEIVATRPWIKPEAMAEMTAFHIRASDGMWIHGYLTLPKSPSNEPRPLVVLPHGGPHFVRDTWGFDPEAQLFASEGFAVLQVNYRGSGGYGEAYQEAGYLRWGDRMVEDIIDATRYTVRKGHADPKRICIYGASFGAYAAMQSAILAPELYRCAIGYAGIYDLTRLDWSGDTGSSWRGRDYVHKVLGQDRDALRKISPAYNADKLTARVFLVHGKQDRRAPIEHAERLRDALEERGRAPEWLVETREGHGFYDEEARERMYSRMVRFLHANLDVASAKTDNAAAGPAVNAASTAPVH